MGLATQACRIVGGLHAQTVSIRSAVDLFWSTANTDVQSTTYADLRGGAKGAMPPPKRGPNKFQERLSGASRMQENLLAGGTPPWTPLG